MYGIASDPDSGGIAVQLVDGTILKLDAGKKNHTVLYRPRGYKTFSCSTQVSTSTQEDPSLFN